jgi:F-type H+-transporting ATPase subunit gamma
MPSQKDLRRRLKTVDNTKLITRAMRSVSASKMRKTQDRRDRIKPYANRLQQLVANVVHSVGSEGQPLMQMKDSGKRLVVIFSSDRGLCGAFNNTIIRYAENYLKSLTDDYEIYAIGKRAGDYFNKHGYPIFRRQGDFRGNIVLDRMMEIAEDLKNAFLNGGFNQVEIIHNYAVTAMIYRPKRDYFLPLKEDELYAGLEAESDSDEALDYIFEPDAQTLLTDLLPKFVETKVYYTFVDAFAAEHQARMLAMAAANDNCVELIDSLTLSMNKARQSDITKEILEIVSGAEALKG